MFTNVVFYIDLSMPHFTRLWNYDITASYPSYAVNTGAAHMLSITAFAGTASISGLRMIRDLESIGAHISSSSDREKVRHICLLSFTTDSMLTKFLIFSL
jgi:predicted Zn-dependent peptidase